MNLPVTKLLRNIFLVLEPLESHRKAVPERRKSSIASLFQ